MAAPARKLPAKRDQPSSVLAKRWKPIQVVVAQQIAMGRRPPHVAKQLQDHIAPRTKEAVRAKVSRQTVRNWLKSEAFRDLIYEYSLLDLELEIPAIFKGVAKKAKAGRVDAAKLVLEVTQRHTDKGEAPPAEIHINFPGVPRPASTEASYKAVDDEDGIVDVEPDE